MKHFKTLTEFITYCEDVCSMDENNDEFFLLTILANVSTVTKERILEDLNKCLTVYYEWLKLAINEEMYLNAAQIVLAKQCELEHFITLSNVVIREDITEDVIALDLLLNETYL